MLVGVDIGGTFTDLVLSVDGRLKIHKLLSTPANPATAMLEGLDIISPDGLSALRQIAHGSTVSTNAILERKGAKVAFITTQGFRDMLFIGRQNRPDLYALHPTIPTPLIPRDLCYEVPERLNYRGDVLHELELKALDHILDSIEKEDVDAIAVCFLYSFINADHEHIVRERIIERGLVADWQIALSSDVLPEFREYERASTTVLEAYVRPIMSRYVNDLITALPDEATLRIMKSDGGVMRAERVQEEAIQTALSGPAAGVIGAFHLSKLAGFDHIITLDMGGTSTDVALFAGEATLSQSSEIDGLPLRARLLDIDTIGAGGGSIARVDAGGALRVGPESAGANPGPIIYGRKGKNITVSDANAILGRLDPEHFLGGTMPLDLKSATKAFKKLAKDIDKTVIDTAKGVIDVANVSIDRALRRVSVAKGHDPRNFTLVAFGGAGPLHACEVADRLGMTRILIPRYPGVLCAYGLLVADVKVNGSLPILVRANRDIIARLRAIQSELLVTGRDDLRREGIQDDDMDFTIYLDMRYEGQSHEISIPFTANVIKEFHTAHANAYGHSMENKPVEIVNMRMQAIGYIQKPDFTPEVPRNVPLEEAHLGDKQSPLGGIMALYDREALSAGMRFNGEALVFQLDSTIYIAQGWSARVDGYRNLILEKL
ncbi:MAG: hydantoinase/oxoprolinase family protein [Phototrophicaceae bacterium]